MADLLNALGDAWERDPEQRLGQFLCNVMRDEDGHVPSSGAIFLVTDEDLHGRLLDVWINGFPGERAIEHPSWEELRSARTLDQRARDAAPLMLQMIRALLETIDELDVLGAKERLVQLSERVMRDLHDRGLSIDDRPLDARTPRAIREAYDRGGAE